ncbi:MAG: sulfatase [Rikenellaceae bacterium]
MNRTLFLGGALTMLSSAVIGGEQPRNVLLIVADDFGWNDTAFMGSDYYETPNLDRLARSGVVFTDGYAACSVSSPSRASIMTGLFTPRHGVTTWIGDAAGEEWRKKGRASKMLPSDYAHFVDHSQPMISEMLKEGGYSTYFIGKWHLGDEECDLPDGRGFDLNIGGWGAGSPRGGYFAPYDNPRLESGEDGENLTMRLANETVKILENHQQQSGDKPFFTYLAFYAVHGPIQTTESKWSYFRDKAERMGIAEEGYVVDRTLPVRQRQDNPIYAGLVQQMDDAVGVVLDRLEQLGLDKNTLVIFTSDNGGVSSGDAFSTSLLPLRGGKGRQWEGGIRVPFVVRNPYLDSAGESCSTAVCGVDILPTIASFAGLDKRCFKGVDGVDIAPLLSGGEIDERPLFWHYPHYGNQGGEPSSIIRRGEWKLIYYHEDGRNELYNLHIDIGESEPLNAQYPEIVANMSRELQRWLKSNGAVMPVADPEYNPQAESEAKLKWRTKLLSAKERERLQLLQPNYTPNADWWGSQVTRD